MARRTPNHSSPGLRSSPARLPVRQGVVIEKTPDELRIRIVPPRQWSIIVFLSAWLCGWTAAEVAVSFALLRRPLSYGHLFLLVWLAMWSAGGWVTGKMFLWKLLGREEITVANGQMVLRRIIGPWVREKVYLTREISGIWFEPFPVVSLFRPNSSIFGPHQGPICFQYEGATVRFGSDLDELEAGSVISALQKRTRKG